jgi:hypothetical protein
MRPVALLPVETSTKEVVSQQLETIVSETGVVPRAILSDEGSDLAGGIDRFCLAHPETTRHRDMPHMAARLLKKRLEKNARWNTFLRQVTHTKLETAQTELAFLAPPRMRVKARYMNLQSMLRWSEKVLAVLDDPSLVAPAFCDVDRLRTKFGWLRAYQPDIQRWSSWLALTDASLDVVRRHGYSSSTSQRLEEALSGISQTADQYLLRNELVEIVQAESEKVRAGERIPASTEILESSFGKLKAIEGDQSRSGFTSLILVWAALFGATTAAVIRQAITEVPVKIVRAWIKKNLGQTVQSKRAKLAHAMRENSTENPEEP